MPNWKVIVTVVLGTLLGFMLNPNAPLGAAVFGAPPAGGVEPTGGQVGALMVVALIESIAFGLGIAFLLFGRAAMARRLGAGTSTTLAHLAIVWALVSWVPHTAMHMTAGEDFARLIGIEYAFHVTLVAAAAALAWAFVRAPAPRAGDARPTSA